MEKESNKKWFNERKIFKRFDEKWYLDNGGSILYKSDGLSVTAQNILGGFFRYIDYRFYTRFN